jgi:hypothetical protein
MLQGACLRRRFTGNTASEPCGSHLVWRAEGHGLGPLPVGIHVEEVVQQDGGGGPREALAHMPVRTHA